ncbi:MAG: class I SAM-dependent RNA methyltransferase, partial [Crocinitomicaceae bacterium]|nr:class I SAM-dependent RNA methyltransferase [Crocinitomicaceae bacterium]
MLTENFRISVKTFQFLEPVLADELRALGATDIEIGRRIVHCTVTRELLYKANFVLRTALRVLVPVQSFSIRHSDELHRRAMKIEWTQFLQRDQTFAIDPQVNSFMFRHSHFASLRLKDAIADHFNERFGSRPNVDADHPDVLFHLHIDNEKVTIALDSSGSSLNQRGYRRAGGKAPLNEVLAAGMILLSGWDKQSPICDPMCGSGTLSIEAYMIASGLPAQINREVFG